MLESIKISAGQDVRPLCEWWKNELYISNRTIALLTSNDRPIIVIYIIAVIILKRTGNLETTFHAWPERSVGVSVANI